MTETEIKQYSESILNIHKLSNVSISFILESLTESVFSEEDASNILEYCLQSN